MSSPVAQQSNDDNDGPIYYLGYGPIVNKVVRKRRGLQTSDEQAAMLPEHRLTFAFGGKVNIVPQRGYEVYGVLMTFRNKADWEEFQKFDAGYNLDQVQVYPCQTPDKAVTAYTFVMKDFDGEKLDSCVEKLPQERYLKLIASGLRSYNVDEDYVQDQIMSVPYVPKAKPENFLRFPLIRQPLPSISFADYEERLCRNATPGNTYFVIEKRVFKIDPHDPENPCAVWVRTRCHGQPDITFFAHIEVVDPDIPAVDNAQELTKLHYRWCEHNCLEYLKEGDLTATAVFELAETGETSAAGGPSGPAQWCSAFCCCWLSQRDCSEETPEYETSNDVQASSASSPISRELMRRDTPRGHDPETDEESTG